LVYAQQRWLDPSTGRFLSLDPVAGALEDPLSTQGFTYAHANPTRYTDPDGRRSQERYNRCYAALGDLRLQSSLEPFTAEEKREFHGLCEEEASFRFTDVLDWFVEANDKNVLAPAGEAGRNAALDTVGGWRDPQLRAAKGTDIEEQFEQERTEYRAKVAKMGEDLGKHAALSVEIEIASAIGAEVVAIAAKGIAAAAAVTTKVVRSKIEGMARENIAKKLLESEFSKEAGYSVQAERRLRDKSGKRVKDAEGGGRVIDFVVVKDGKVVRSFEVTSPDAPKAKQLEKEQRLRGADGNYIKDRETGQVLDLGDVVTEVVRVDLNAPPKAYKDLVGK
jgi:hypothetical protein